MKDEILQLSPLRLWHHFYQLNQVPRGSKKEEKVIEFMVAFGEKLGLETLVDTTQNVLIRKPATVGMENRKTVVLQSHLDMVHQKNANTQFDFDKQGIEMYVDGDWVKAKGTTLGADNGLGVAAIMSILESTDISHPAIEALFTIDEETGMTGAKGLQANFLKGEILLNLDTENDSEIDVGCAGGIDVSATKSYTEVDVNPNSTALNIVVNGLNGGHSGMDIHKGLGNANKILNRIFYETLPFNYSIVEINGGSLRNAIPRESFATIIVSNDDKAAFLTKFNQVANTIKTEFETMESGLQICLSETQLPEKTMLKQDQELFIKTIYAAHNGVYRMSPDMEDLVETSNNIAIVNVKDGQVQIHCLTRSSVESSKMDLANALKSAFELGGFKVSFTGSYPGWKPNMKSSILKTMTEVYEDLFQSKANVVACHAGLECGILGSNYPNMEMISFGPTITGAHSPDEKASISSSQKFWKFLLEVLKKTPVK
ncbi:MAG: aminoacyl-histidine dipeptidase [Flavobacteriaceae bacterium]|nr:aminoacyl-histidine dipeptidase [Flavobacteriaceae bacterium]